MRKLLLAFTTGATLLILVMTAAPALAGDPVECSPAEQAAGICTITDPGGGTPGGGTPGGGTGHPDPGAGCVANGATIPCTNGSGTWSSDRQCYIAAASPQPPDPAAAGGRPGDTLYNCTTLAGAVSTFWSPIPPGGLEGLLNPEDLARQAIATMGLGVFQVGMAPEAGGTGYVGLPVWMWAANPGPSTIGPITAAAGAVSATAKMSEADWNMGDGHVVTCRNGGTPYADSYGNSMSPTCGYRYNQASSDEAAGVYAVTVTAKWTVNWTGMGRTGVINLTFNSPVTQVRIAELQAVGQ